MSVIGKKPIVTSLLDNLSVEELQTLQSRINNSLFKQYDDALSLYNSEYLGNIHIPGFNGVYIHNYLFNYESDTQQMKVYEIDSEGNMKDSNEYVSILELRSELNDRMIEAGAVIPENVKFTVTNIKSLTDAQCEDLKVGDMVAKKTGNQNHVYVVTYKEKNQGLCLTYADASVVETQSYDYVGGHWVYNSEDKTELGGGLPEVTAEDNEKVLEVIAGAWGIGRKKVSIMDAPSSTTLNEKEMNAILGGIHINGIFLGRKNPVFFPAVFSEQTSEKNTGGYMISSSATTAEGGYNSSYLSIYKININTREIVIRKDLISFGITNNNGTLNYNELDISNITNLLRLNNRAKPQVEVALTNLGTITSTETATGSGFYKNEIPYTAGIGVEDVINVKMSNGAVYQAINDTTNSKLVIYTGVDFASNSISVSKCWKLAY